MGEEGHPSACLQGHLDHGQRVKAVCHQLHEGQVAVLDGQKNGLGEVLSLMARGGALAAWEGLCSRGLPPLRPPRRFGG